MLRRGFLGKFADYRKDVVIVAGGFYHHKNRNGQYYAFENAVDADHPIGHCRHKRVNDPLDDQPGREKIEALKGMKSHDLVVAEFASRENNHGRDPADGGDVAQDRGSPGRKPGKRVLRRDGWRLRLTRRVRRIRRRRAGCRSAGLAATALGAEDVPFGNRVAALSAKRHLL